MLTYDLQTGDQPKYYRLYTCIREDILRAELPPGQKLPSKRALAEHLHISLATVSGAYEQLVDEGYLTAKPRSGYYVSAISRLPQNTQPQTRLRMLPADAPAAQEPAGYGFRYSALTRLMREVIADCGTRLLEKPPHYGCAELRNAIAEYLLRYRGMLAQPDCIVIGSGAEYLYGLIVQLLGAARIYAAEDPSYEKIALVYRAHGASLELLPLGADGICSDALAATRASVLHITPYRSYPSNVTASAAKRREYIRWASEPGRYIVEDDFSSEFTVASKPEETVFSLAESGNVIYLNTFSQTVAPSLRMGYMVLSEKLAAQYAERIGFYSCTVPLFEQLVLAELLESGDYERHIRRTRRTLRKRTEK